MKNGFKIHKQKGSFLVELMAGLLMSSVAVLGVLTIYSEFEGQKRTTTEMTATLTNAALSMFALQHEIKNAGYGINKSSLMGCTINAYNEDKGDFTFSLAPVKITRGADDKTPDEISLFFGDSNSFFAPISLTRSQPTSSSVLRVSSRFGFTEGDLVIVGQEGQECSLMQVTGLPGGGQADHIVRNPGNYTDPVTGEKKPAKFNKSGGLGITYGAGATVLNIGGVPSNITYRITGSDLMRAENLMDEGISAIVGSNIVMLKGIYGLDKDTNGIVEEWTNRTLLNSEYVKVRAVRLAIISRSPLREKAENGSCSVTTSSQFTWLGGTIDISGIPDWGCYRYRKIETTVPVRNLMWGL